ncbi:acyl-CoA reductase-like NAD-dependent aldehyde dehydrogenase [Bradyrhizobium sp. F1.4.3]
MAHRPHAQLGNLVAPAPASILDQIRPPVSGEPCRGKRRQALGGAKNHMIVMPDADMVHAVDALKNLTAKVRALNVGPGTSPEMGPLATNHISIRSEATSTRT